MCPHGVNLVMATAEGAIRLFKIDRKFAKPRVLEVTGKSRTSTLPAACTPAPQLRQQTAPSSMPGGGGGRGGGATPGGGGGRGPG